MNQQLRVNPIACTGHGLCAELLSERVILDEWGYPVISPEPIPTRLRKAARRAVTDCPALALLLTSGQQARQALRETTEDAPSPRNGR
jgi:ferredoxin